MGNLGKKVSQTNSMTQLLDPFLCHKNKKESFQTPVPRTQASNPINRLKMTAVFRGFDYTGRKTSDPTCMFHSEMTSLYLGKVDVGVSAGSLVTKYGGLSNCERSIFVRSTVEAGTLSSTTGAAIGWQGTRTEQLSSMIFLFLLCSVSAFLRGKPVGRRQFLETWTPQHPFPCMDLGILALIRVLLQSR